MGKKKKPKKSNKYRNPANPELAAAMHELRRSSAASPHDTRPHRQRTRKTDREQSIRESNDN